MSYADRVASILPLLEAHNKLYPDINGPGRIFIGNFMDQLMFLTSGDESRLKGISFEALGNILPTIQGIRPMGLIQDIAKIFRGGEKYADSVSGKESVSSMTPRRLVELFDPSEPESKVATRLKGIARSEPFIVFSSGRTVDIETTTKLLLEIKDGHKGRQMIELAGDMKQVYSIGELPDNYADENPIWKGRALRPDGTCDQTLKSWDGVSLTVRQLIYLAVETGEFNVNVPNGDSFARDLINMALAADAEKTIKARFPKAALKYKQMSDLQTLPRLKIELSSANKNRKPFDNGKKVN